MSWVNILPVVRHLQIAVEKKAKCNEQKRIAAEKKAKSDEQKRIAAEEKEPAKFTTLPKKSKTKRKHLAKGDDYLDQTERKSVGKRKKARTLSSSSSSNDTLFNENPYRTF